MRATSTNGLSSTELISPVDGVGGGTDGLYMQPKPLRRCAEVVAVFLGLLLQWVQLIHERASGEHMLHHPGGLDLRGNFHAHIELKRVRSGINLGTSRLHSCAYRPTRQGIIAT